MKIKINRQMKRSAELRAAEMERDAAEPLPDRDIYVREKLRRKYKKGHFQGDPVTVYLKDNPPALKSERQIEIDFRKIRKVKRVKVSFTRKQTRARTMKKVKPIRRGAYTLPPIPDFYSNHYEVPSREYSTKVPTADMWAHKSSKHMVLESVSGRVVSEHREIKAAQKSAAQMNRKGVATQIYTRA